MSTLGSVANPLKIFVPTLAPNAVKSLKINSTFLDLLHDKWIFWDYFICIYISHEKCPKEIEKTENQKKLWSVSNTDNNSNWSKAHINLVILQLTDNKFLNLKLKSSLWKKGSRGVTYLKKEVKFPIIHMHKVIV